MRSLEPRSRRQPHHSPYYSPSRRGVRAGVGGTTAASATPATAVTPASAGIVRVAAGVPGGVGAAPAGVVGVRAGVGGKGGAPISTMRWAVRGVRRAVSAACGRAGGERMVRTTAARARVRRDWRVISTCVARFLAPRKTRRRRVSAPPAPPLPSLQPQVRAPHSAVRQFLRLGLLTAAWGKLCGRRESVLSSHQVCEGGWRGPKGARQTSLALSSRWNSSRSLTILAWASFSMALRWTRSVYELRGEGRRGGGGAEKSAQERLRSRGNGVDEAMPCTNRASRHASRHGGWPHDSTKQTRAERVH